MLTHREQQMLALLGTGASNKDIALCLHLSENTVEKYLSNLYRKLAVRSRVGAILWYENMIKKERQDDNEE